MRSKTTICDYSACTGCAACINICPSNAVHMISDECGYKYPKINLKQCTDCSLCEKTCPVLHPVSLYKAEHSYAVAAIDENLRKSCSSGGMASIISQKILEQDGIVYGCAQISYCDIRHIRVNSSSQLPLLKGSKYVQSEINTIYRNVKEDLNSGCAVLFSGTPCQIAGLKNYLRKDYENLYTLDLICHGVPSQQMLIDDIDLQMSSQTKEMDSRVLFRWKTQYGIQFGIQFGEGKKICLPHDPYILAFFTGLSFRENCHSCPYSQVARVGDITVGDFWGLGAQSHTQFKIKDGVSLVLVNTEKGLKLWQNILPYVKFEQHSLTEAINGNGNLHSPSRRPAGKDIFIQEYKRHRNLKKACNASISKSNYFRLLIKEKIKRLRLLVFIFKKMRFTLYKINCKKENSK